ncbi:MAG: potassium-transporting ATPase subunit KdpC [Peptococcaceae bacterium]|jgi:K+-transporting ATPase ATPase C chain|nr:potassium-transporting ATPase subunit KdpC [Peptococcaceae bacterium]
MKTLKTAVLLLLFMTILTGVAYPLAVTGLAQGLFPRQADGSIIYRDGRPVGSSLIGQKFSGPGYFHGRPSAAGHGYDATASGGSNLGPTSKTLIKHVARRAALVRKENGLPPGAPVPSDLVTSSASGLDPDISPAAAFLQVPRVAKARHLSEDQVRTLVQNHIKGPELGFMGNPRVNVLRLNLALDKLAGKS